MENKNRNQIVRSVFLCLTPALAATVSFKSSLAMAVGIIAIVVLSTGTMRVLRKAVSDENRSFVTLVVTTMYASIYQMVCEAFFIEAYGVIGVYIALVSISLMVFNSSVDVADKGENTNVAKAFIFSVVYGVSMCVIGAIREVLGLGTLGSATIGYFASHKVQIMQKAPGAFMVAAIVTAVIAAIANTKKNKEAE